MAFVVLTVIGLSSVALPGVISRRETINFAVHGGLAAKMGFACSLVAAVAIGALSLSSAGRTAGAEFVLLPLAPLALAAFVFIVHEITQAELRLRRDILEMEHRMTQSAETRGKPAGG